MTQPTYDQLKAKVAEYKAAIEAVKCFQCGDGLTPLYCLNCAREGLEKENAELKAAITQLGYEDGDPADNVLRYKRYAESEIKLRDEGSKKLQAYTRKLQELLPPETALQIAREMIAPTMTTPDFVRYDLEIRKWWWRLTSVSALTETLRIATLNSVLRDMESFMREHGIPLEKPTI